MKKYNRWYDDEIEEERAALDAASRIQEALQAWAEGVTDSVAYVRVAVNNAAWDPCIEPDDVCTWAAISGVYTYCLHYHRGQWSAEYEMSGVLGHVYSPGGYTVPIPDGFKVDGGPAWQDGAVDWYAQCILGRESDETIKNLS